MNVHISRVICLDCKRDMLKVEGTNKRFCGWCERTVTIEVIEE
jgi:hypothetical protein